MTAADVLRALARRWYVVVLGVGLTVWGIAGSWPERPVYSARASVVFLWPGSLPLARTNDGGVGPLVNFTAMVRRALPSDDSQALASTSFGGTLAGAGVRSGYTVELPNAGGQWAKSYDEPRLDVEGVGASEQEAVAHVRSVMTSVNATASSLQTRLAVLPGHQITLSWTDPIEVTVLSSTAATRARGAAALGGAGTMVTVMVSVAVDRLRPRRALRASHLETAA